MSKSRNIADLGSNDVLETTATGVDVTGTISADALDIAGAITADGLTVANTSVFAGTFDGGSAATYVRWSDPTDNWILGSNNGLGSFLIKNETADANRMLITSGGDIQFYEDTGTTPKLTWDASAESLGIGTSSPSSPLHISGLGAGYSKLQITETDTNTDFVTVVNGGVGYIGMQTNDPLAFLTNDTERARIDSSGNLLVGTTSGDFSPKMAVHSGGRTYTLEVKADSGTNAPLLIRNNNGLAGTRNQAFFLYGGTTTGSITSTSSSTSFNTTSDQRLKENIQDTTHTVDINDIRVREFDWKVDGKHQRFGFIAQELETVYPEAVHSPDDPEEMKSVDYSKLVPLLVKEIQTLKARIETLENN
jgi:hypothetical protein